MFNIGDIIIGNQYASDLYSITRTGTVWKVTETFDDNSIQVSPGGWVVDADYFDLKEPAMSEANVDTSELDNMFDEFA